MEPFFVEGGEPNLKALFIPGSDSLADNPAVNVFRPPPQQWRHAESWWPAGLRIAWGAILLIGLAQPSAWASDSRDHERARAAVEAGQVLPLPTLLERLRRTHPGQVLELELEREDGRWIYEVKLMQANGQLLKLAVDASTAQVMEVKRKAGRSADRDPGRQVTPSKEPPK